MTPTNPTSENGAAPVTASPARAPRRPLMMRLLGLKRRPGKLLRVGLSRWGWCLWPMVVLLGGGLAFAEYTMQPEFCNSCHIMQPYFTAWHTSTHSKVPCADCHFEPGLKNTLKGKWQASSQAIKYITNTYGSKPHAEIRDESCMRSGCHEKRLLEGAVRWTVPSQRGGKVTIRFDHAPHLKEERRGKQLRCVSCHSQIVQGQHIVVTLDTCFLCHFKGLEHGRNEQALGGCSACHDAPQSQIKLATGLFSHSEYTQRGVGCQNCHSDAIKGDGAVPRQVCWTCHNLPKQVARYGETAFVHTTHISKHKVECSSCHIQIEHSLSAGVIKEKRRQDGLHVAMESGNCGSCHENSHGGPADLYRGVGGRGVPEMPSPMHRAQVDCIACHKARKGDASSAAVVGQTFLAMQEACDHCHGTKYAGRLDEWRQTIKDTLQKAEALYADAKDQARKAPLGGESRLRAERALDDAAHNIRLVKLGHGVHNVNYAVALLNVAMERCKSAHTIAATERQAGGHESSKLE